MDIFLLYEHHRNLPCHGLITNASILGIQIGRARTRINYMEALLATSRYIFD